MPHQCTDCGRRFDDGSKEMLSGCPECGGTKFQFLPDAQAVESTPGDPPPVEEPDSSVARKVGHAATAVRDFVGSSGGESTAAGPERAATPETPSSGRETDSVAANGEDGTSTQQTEVPSPSTRTATGVSASTKSRPETASMQTANSEDDAQASARSEVVSPDELPPAPEQSGWEETTPGPQPEPDSEPDSPEQTERPDLSELRAELNQQFESIKVLEPGQYELNLMELFDREEYIIALQEDGKYTVQVPEHWQQ
jgi:predicted  nucleic acid-binding Zn-ribbon protein